MGVVDGTASYLYGELGDVVGGNTFNADGVNGADKTVPLGNLTVGSSAAQFNKLAGKWLLGSDNPTWVFGTVTSFTANTGPLFGSSGVAATDPSQGAISDRYLIAAAVEVAFFQPGMINTVFTGNGDVTYGLQFYAPTGAAIYAGAWYDKKEPHQALGVFVYA